MPIEKSGKFYRGKSVKLTLPLCASDVTYIHAAKVSVGQKFSPGVSGFWVMLHAGPGLSYWHLCPVHTTNYGEYIPQV